MVFRFLIMILLAAGLGQTSPVKAETLPEDLKESLVTGLEKTYANKSFSADFEQVARLTALDLTEIATGKAWFSHPGKMRWRYDTPDVHEIITNGTTLWIFRPEENQVMQGSAAPFFKAGAGGSFLSDISRIRNNYKISLGKTDPKFAELILTPKKENPDLKSIGITIDLPSHQIQIVATENIYGDTTRFYFTHIIFEDPDPDNFSFTLPEGVSIIEMN
ncbi:MAG: outer membrane lipoprotein carrier protein LolA [Desulfobacter sp.]|nr:MAG: outer membrane lipoprotein carrier protein LolA [Desulfobacter sp.]